MGDGRIFYRYFIGPAENRCRGTALLCQSIIAASCRFGQWREGDLATDPPPLVVGVVTNGTYLMEPDPPCTMHIIDVSRC